MMGRWTTRPWLAGVCARMAAALGGSVWGFRVVWLALLIFKPLLAIGAYLVLALVFELLPQQASSRRGPDEAWLKSPELAGRARRIAELDRRVDRAA